MARNPGFIDSMQRALETEVLVPAEPEFVGALGAALIAAERVNERAEGGDDHGGRVLALEGVQLARPRA